MERRIHVQRIGIDQQKKLSPSRAIKHNILQHPSLSVSHIKKGSLSRRHRSLPSQHFPIESIRLNDVIHTNIRASRDNINPIHNKLSDHNKHLRSTSYIVSASHHHNGSEKSINNQKLVNLVKNKVKPVNVTKIHRYRESVEKLSNNAFKDDCFNEDSPKQNSPLSTIDDKVNVQQEHGLRKSAPNNINSPKTKIDNQNLSIVTIDSNQLDNGSDVTNQKTPSVSSQKNSTNESNHKSKIRKNRSSSYRCKRLSLCALLTPFAALLLVAAIAALVIALIKPKTVASPETTPTSIAFTNTTATITSPGTTSINMTSTNANATVTTTITITSTIATSLYTNSTTTTDIVTTTYTTIISTAVNTTYTTNTTTTDVSTTTTITTSVSTTTTTTTFTTTTITTSATSTTTTTTSTTSVPLVNPCSNGIYWNVTGVKYAGNGIAGSALNQLSSPTGIFINSNDTLYISDSFNCRILSYLRNATSGTIAAGTGVCGTAFDQFSANGSRYSYVDASQNIYVSDVFNNRVIRWTSGGSSGVIVAGNGIIGNSLNQLAYPYGVWVDSNSNVFVTEYNNHRVTKWAAGASNCTVVAGITGVAGVTTNKLSSPTGLYYDEVNQNLYIANAAANTVMRWRVGNSNGTIIAGVAGSSGSNSNLLSFPSGITLDQWQNIYVNDRTNDRIQLFCNGSSTGITIAGSGTSGSTLSYPFDVKLDSRLNLYVADYGAQCVTNFFKL